MAQEKHLKADIAVIGGGTGGVAAALAACAMGKRVVLTEETKWIGGQLTAQAVPPDENPAIENFGGTLRYLTWRNRVRQFYLDHYPVAERIRKWYRDQWPNPSGNSWHPAASFNPGGGNVSALCHEFKVGLAVMEQMLLPYESSGYLRILRHNQPVAAETDGDRVRSVQVRNNQTGEETVIEAPYFLDATELGDLLPMTGTEYVVGFESKDMTGEPHARDTYEPLNQQAISWTFALEWAKEGEHVIGKPEQYDFWRDYIPDLTPAWPGKLLSFTDVHPGSLETRSKNLRYSLWNFRRICDPENFADADTRADLTLVNWPEIDYFLGPIIDVSEEEKQKHLKGAEQLSLSWLYWLQTEAPHAEFEEPGEGYPQLKLRPDICGDAPNELALYPYIRESRRIEAEFTVCEQQVDKRLRGESGAEPFHDSVGIGHYNIDLHPSTGGDNYIDVPCCPHQIPLGALIPKRMENLLPACKNLGVTHLTNGAYRLHPIEWNIGEAAAILAAHCLDKDLAPRLVRNDAKKLEDFQSRIRAHGITMNWPRVFSERPVLY